MPRITVGLALPALAQIMAPFPLGKFFCDNVFCFLFRGGVCSSYGYGAKYHAARKLAKRNGAIIYAKIGVPDPRVPRPPNGRN